MAQYLHVKTDDYALKINPAYAREDLVDQILQLRTDLSHQKSEPLTLVSNARGYQVYQGTISLRGQTISVYIKRQQYKPGLKSKYDEKYKNGVHLARCWHHALALWENGEMTPEPLALLTYHRQEKCEILMLTRSYEGKDFRTLLSQILWQERSTEPLLNAIKAVVTQIRKLHDAGFVHGDLGNQNILLKRDKNDFHGVVFIDLDRCQFKPPLTLKHRGSDLNKILLPTAYMQYFLYMYFNNHNIPKQFTKALNQHRRLFNLRQRSHHLRHPTKSRVHKQHQQAKRPSYPKAQDLWVWEEKQSQPTIVLSRLEKLKLRGFKNIFGSLYLLMKHRRLVMQKYQQVLANAFSQQVAMQDKIGIALHPDSRYMSPEQTALEDLGHIPVLIRLCHHESPSQWERTIDYIISLHQRGISVALALVQDRQAVTNPSLWLRFVQTIVPKIHAYVAWIEVGHAVNRSKWGIWTRQDCLQLLEPFQKLQNTYPKFRIMGPPVIDFDSAWTTIIGSQLPTDLKLHGLSQHLYVDRRGHPEAFQNQFSTLEKCAFGRATALVFPQYQGRFVISEVNWPLKNTGTFSPIFAPYVTPGQDHKKNEHGLGVTEHLYACYMIRYLAIALCSGFVDAVYWWRLSAKGYGLLDDQDDFRRRPAFFALRYFLQKLGKATFIKRLTSEPTVYLLLFQQKNEQQTLLAWTSSTQDKNVTLENEITQISSHLGEKMVLAKSDEMILTGAPIYLDIAPQQA